MTIGDIFFSTFLKALNQKHEMYSFFARFGVIIYISHSPDFDAAVKQAVRLVDSP